jgi:hypothetical protein
MSGAIKHALPSAVRKACSLLARAVTASSLLSVLALASPVLAQQTTSSASQGACAPSQAASGAQPALLVELYTSEGCDSCPPADRWLSSLKAKPSVVALAYHVDYWDYIGWKDRFANPVFTERQRAAAARHGSRTVYTPQVMFGGKDSREWLMAGTIDVKVREQAARAPRATLRAQITPASSAVGVALNIAVADASQVADAALLVALTEDNLQSRVTAGENKGVTLRHDHVVRASTNFLPLKEATSTRDVQLAIPPDAKVQNLNVVAFVQNTRNGEILQAMGSALCAK